MVKFSPQPLTSAELQRRLPAVAAATLFRNLEYFVRRGEIFVIDGPDGKRRYVGQAYHSATFRCQRCGKERVLTSATLPAYVDRKMFGRQEIVTSQLIAQGFCASCMKKIYAKH